MKSQEIGTHSLGPTQPKLPTCENEALGGVYGWRYTKCRGVICGHDSDGDGRLLLLLLGELSQLVE